MRLTRELADLCFRVVPESNIASAYDYFTEADYPSALEHLLSSRPAGPVWLFAYGSLMWKPEVEAVEQRHTLVRDWHRGFSMKIESHRATPEQPGYMMCLDPGGSCEGVVLRLAEDNTSGQIMKLLRREVGSTEALDAVRWIPCETDAGTVQALTFYAKPDQLDIYKPDTPVSEIVHALARACGYWGSGADYLRNTVERLESLAIHDEGLWLLQDLVAAEIETIYGIGASPKV